MTNYLFRNDNNKSEDNNFEEQGHFILKNNNNNNAKNFKLGNEVVELDPISPEVNENHPAFRKVPNSPRYEDVDRVVFL